MLCEIFVSTFLLVLLYIYLKVIFWRPLITPIKSLPNPSNGKGINPNSVMIFMVATDEINDYSVHSIEMNKAYAKKHSYRFEIIRENLVPDMPINFTKIEAARRFAKDPSIKYIVHIDADAVVIKDNYPITAIINTYMGWGTHIIMGEDCYNKKICSKPGRINSGVFIVKNTDPGRAILNTWLESARTGPCKKYVNVFPNCQLVFFNCVMMSSLRRYIKIVPYNLINGIDGLFIKHMMQHNTDERVEEFINIQRKNGKRVSLY